MGSTTKQRPSSALRESDYRDQADFRYALRRFARFSELQAHKEGITPQQHLILLMIRGHPSYPLVSIGDVAERMQLKHHSASLLIDRAVKRGFLNRVTDENDRRRVLVSLTPSGQAVLDDITKANREELGALESQLFRSSFVDTLRKQSGEETSA